MCGTKMQKQKIKKTNQEEGKYFLVHHIILKYGAYLLLHLMSLYFVSIRAVPHSPLCVLSACLV